MEHGSTQHFPYVFFVMTEEPIHWNVWERRLAIEEYYTKQTVGRGKRTIRIEIKPG